MVTAAVGNDVISALLCCDWLHSLSQRQHWLSGRADGDGGGY